jgi:hypothetical protein
VKTNIVATAKLRDCLRTESIDELFLEGNESAFGDYSPGRWAWILSDVRKTSVPIPCKGSLGLWSIPEEIESALVAGFKEK